MHVIPIYDVIILEKKKNVDVESNWKATLYCVESAIACFIKDKCNCEGYVVPFDKKRYQ